MKKALFLNLIGIFCILSSVIGSDSLLIKAWNEFNLNNRNDAKSHFIDALKEDNLKEEAYLGLCLIAITEANHEKAFDYFLNFYKIASDPYPYVYSLWYTDAINHNYYGKKPEKYFKFYQTIISDPRANGTIKAMAYSMLGYCYEKQWDFKNAEKVFSKLGMSDKWLITGVFDNFSENGFNKNYEPIFNPHTDAEFYNKNNAPVKWFKVFANRSDRWLDFTYHFNIVNSVVYAQSFVFCPDDRNVVIRTGVSGSVKLWVNDKIIFSEEEERNTDLDVYNYSARLNKGFNRILIQIGSSEITKSNFMIRITDVNGFPFQDLIYYNEYKPYTKENDFISTNIPIFAESYFEQKVKENPTKILYYILLAETYIRNEKKFQARKILDQARKIAPNNSLIAEKYIELYLRSNNNTDYSKEVEWLKENDKDNITGIKYMINDAIDKENNEELKELLNTYEKISGKDEYFYSISISNAKLLGLNKDIKNIINEAYIKYPDNYSFVYYKYLTEKSSKGTNDGLKFIEKYLKSNFNNDALATLANSFIKSGNDNKGIYYYNKLINIMPYATGYYEELAKYYKNIGNYSKAVNYINLSLQMAPYIGHYYNTLASIYELQGNLINSIKAYEKSLLYDPYNYDTRKQLIRLKNKKMPFNYFDKFDINEIINLAKNIKYTDNSIILFNEKQVVVYKDGPSEERYILLAKVNNTDGINEWKEYSIPYYQNSQNLIIENAEIIKPSGNRIKADINKNYLVFKGININDVIYINYRIENYKNESIINKHFWDNFNFNFFIPCLKSKYELLIDTSYRVEYKILNGQLTFKTKNSDEFNKYTWECDSLPKIKTEFFMPPLSDVGIILHISTINNWNTISKWYLDVSQSK